VGTEDVQVHDCHRTAKRVCSESVFVANVGDTGMDDLDQAVRQGARAIVTDRLLPYDVPQCLVADTRIAYATLCHELAKRPSDKLLTIGVMGTHGKTSTSLLVASMLKSIGGSVAYHTSLGASNGRDSGLPASPKASAKKLNGLMAQAVGHRCPAVVLELTDTMLRERSMAGIQFDVLVIPSLRASHHQGPLERRGHEISMMAACDQLKGHGMVIYNADDARLNQWVHDRELPAIGYALDADAEVRGKRMDCQPGCQSLMITAGRCLMPLTTSCIGDHQARHALAAITTGYAFGLELHEVIGGVERMKKIPGRLQRVDGGQDFAVYVDAADQADRLAVALHAIARHHGGPITCVAEVPEVIDAESRAAYGRVLERAATRTILTQTRRPTLSGQSAMWEVLDGCERPAAIQLVPNRTVAIELALRAARHGEQVLLAGWGSNSWTAGEDRQVRRDEAWAMELLQARGPRTAALESKGAAIR
jgi:UDP-N-acetylmuramoyl-L-alanyl-D-glutamate--2,6-diaminopimelate ligase